MEIYRAVLKYNNADTCEWERWYTRSSVWYSNRKHAEDNLKILRHYLQHLQKKVFKEDTRTFRFCEPYIETQSVHEDFVPIEIKFDNEFYKGVD